MNPSTAQARVLVDELVRGGVREAVLSPGSRNAPLSYALAQADADGRLRLHVRVDERSGGFLALGLARASGLPVAVTCTSGTAVANLHPAVLEADAAAVPLVLLTADRPPELRQTGANQTTEQVGLFGPALRALTDVGVAEPRIGAVAAWRTVVCRALAAATGADPGPVQLNLPLREPLVPDGSPDWIEPLDGRAGGAPWVTRTPAAGGVDAVPGAPRTLVVVGDLPLGSPLVAGLAAAGWPVVAEPSSQVPGLAAGTWLLGDAWLDDHLPTRVLVVGRPTLSRAVGALLRRPEVAVDLLPSGPRWPDPGHVAARVLSALPQGDPDQQWAAAWRAASDAAFAAVGSVLQAAWPSGLRAARDVVGALPVGALLVLGSSNPVRDVDLAARMAAGTAVVANRGLAGIDGLVSTAMGAALAWGGPAYALLGDLALLHDSNGLAVGPAEPRPDLCLVVVDNDGGGIFELLEQGAGTDRTVFERVFGTPHGTDLAALCASHGVPLVEASTPAALAAALAPAPGLRAVRVRTDRARDRALHDRVRQAVAAALR